MDVAVVSGKITWRSVAYAYTFVRAVCFIRYNWMNAEGEALQPYFKHESKAYDPRERSWWKRCAVLAHYVPCQA